MPLPEYFCPQCFGELEVLRPTEVARERRDCPHCGGEVCRVPPGLGSKTESRLQPSGAPFRGEFASRSSGRAGVATATVEEAVRAESRFEGELTGVAVDVSSIVDSQPNGRNTSSVHKGGIASLLRHFRKDAYVKPAEKMQYPEVAVSTMPVEASLDRAPGADQRICYPSVRTRPVERLAEPVRVTESVIVSPAEPVVLSDKPWWPASYVMQWPEEEPQPAVGAQPVVRAWDKDATTADRRLWPRSNFEWFLLVTVVQALTVVPLVWILAVMVL